MPEKYTWLVRQWNTKQVAHAFVEGYPLSLCTKMYDNGGLGAMQPFDRKCKACLRAITKNEKG